MITHCFIQRIRASRNACTFLLAPLLFFVSCQSTSSPQQASASPSPVQAVPQSPASVFPLGPFVKANDLNPILAPRGITMFACPIRQQAVAWEVKDVFNPATIVRDDTVWMLYRAEDTLGQHGGTSRIGLAYSADGLHFERLLYPVLYPSIDPAQKLEWDGGCEDPRLVQDSAENYWMTYTAYDGETARLSIASSPDLRRWVKYGPVFMRIEDGKYMDLWSKSGAIVCRKEGNQMIATRIQGKYWMYWGDTQMFLATSEDLISWTPLMDEQGEFIAAFGPRPGKFDSRLVEPGPPPFLTDSGIVLLYNGMNLPHREGGDPSLAEGAYASGQALLSADDPSQLLRRTPGPFLQPDQPYEIEGQVNQVVFIEGLAFLENSAFLYYGTADSKIGVAYRR
ncbi:MAG: glycoside hydrolase family 130 protein [Bacteroidota bacterium]